MDRPPQGSRAVWMGWTPQREETLTHAAAELAVDPAVVPSDEAVTLAFIQSGLRHLGEEAKQLTLDDSYPQRYYRAGQEPPRPVDAPAIVRRPRMATRSRAKPTDDEPAITQPVEPEPSNQSLEPMSFFRRYRQSLAWSVGGLLTFSLLAWDYLQVVRPDKEPVFTHPEMVALADTTYLARLGLCQKILRDAANDDVADGEFEKAQALNDAANRVSVDAPCVPPPDSDGSVRVKDANKFIVVTAQELVGMHAFGGQSTPRLHSPRPRRQASL